MKIMSDLQQLGYTLEGYSHHLVKTSDGREQLTPAIPETTTKTTINNKKIGVKKGQGKTKTISKTFQSDGTLVLHLDPKKKEDPEFETHCEKLRLLSDKLLAS